MAGPQVATAGEGGPGVWKEGFSLYQAGDWAGAADRFQVILADNPRDVAARVYLVECFRKMGQEDLAVALERGEGGSGEREIRRVEVRREGGVVEVEVGREVRLPGEGKREMRREERRMEFRCRGKDCSSPRSGRPFGFGLSVLGPSGSVGFFGEFTPFSFLSAEVGWGLATVQIQSWWLEAKFLPARGVVSPFVGVGILGLFGVVHRGDWEALGPAGPAMLQRELHPYLTAGMMVMSRKGFAHQFAVGFAATGDHHAPVFVLPGYRMSWHF